MGAELFHTEGRTDDRDTTKFKVAFRNFVNMPDKPRPEEHYRTVSNNTDHTITTPELLYGQFITSC